MWFTENLGNIIVSLILISVFALIIYKMIKNRKKGKKTCGCECGGCNYCSGCIDKKQKS